MKKYHTYIFLCALLWFAATAWFSVGYYHPDEHYQIIEFARLKQGLNVTTDLAWEYEAQIRSTIQPALAYVIFSLLDLFSVTDPYLLMLILRGLTAAFILLAIKWWVQQHQEKFSSYIQPLFIFLSYGLFLIPMVSVRFSSETWSAGCMLMTLNCLAPARISSKRAQLGLGFWLGLAFLFRFQSIFITAGLLLWLWWNNRRSGYVLISMFAVLLWGVMLDRWFYGQWVFTFWNYLDYNLIRGVAASYGIAPWYEYFLYTYEAFTPFLGVLVLLSVFYFLLRYRYHMLTWMLIPFLLVHMFIAHKEDRFLFPLIYFLPFILCTGIEDMKRFMEGWKMKWPVLMFQCLLVICLLCNVLGLVITSLTPLKSRLVVTEYIQEQFAGQQVVLLNATRASPFFIGANLYARHYVQESLEEIAVNSLCELERYRYPDSVKVLLMVSQNATNNDGCQTELQHENDWRLLVQSTPPWLYWLRGQVGWKKEERNVLLYERILR